MAVNAGTAFITILADMTKFGTSVSAGVRSAQSSLNRIGKSMTKYVTLPILAAAGASVKLAVDFEASMSKVAGLAGQSRQQVAAWSEEILNLAPKLATAPKELADALYFVASSGIDASKAIDVVTVSAKASAAGLGETQVVADAVTSAMNAYRTSNLSAAHATDVLVAAVREGKGEADSFAATMGSVLPTASELGVSFEDVAAALASMTLVGDSAEEAGTKINAIMSALLKVTPAAAEAFRSVGLNVATLRDEMGDEGLLPVLQQIKAAVGGDTEVLAAMFPNVRALRGILSLVGNNADHVAEVFTSLGQATGSLDTAFEEASHTAEFQFQQMLAGLEAAAIKFGTVILPPILAVGKAFAAFFSLFGHLPPGFMQLAAIFLGVSAALGPLFRLMSKMPDLIRGVAANWAKLGAFLTTPWGLAIGAATVAIGTLLYTMGEIANRERQWHEAIHQMSADLVELADSADTLDPVLHRLQSNLDDIQDAFTFTLRANPAQGIDPIIQKQEIAAKSAELMADTNQGVATALRSGAIDIEHAANLYHALEIEFGKVDTSGRTAVERLLQIGSTIEDFDATDYLNFFDNFSRDIPGLATEIEGVITAQRDQGHLTKGEYQEALTAMGYEWDEIKQKIKDAGPVFEGISHAVRVNGRVVTVFAGKTAEQFNEWAKQIHNSVNDFIFSQTKFREAFKLSTKELQKQLSEQAKIAEQTSKDFKKLFDAAIPEDLKSRIADMGPEFVHAFVEGGVTSAGKLTTAGKDMVKNLQDIDSNIGNVDKAIGELPDEIKTEALIDTKPARDEMNRLQEDLANMGFRLTATGDLSIGGPQRHGGGMAGMFGDMHRGPLKGDELMTILQKGEFVVQRDVVNKPGMKKFLQALNSGRYGGEYHTGGLISANQIQFKGLTEELRQTASMYNAPPVVVGKVDIDLPSADEVINKLIGSIAGASGFAGASPNALRYAGVIRALFGNLPMGITNRRTILGTNTWSQHAYGNAVDVMTGASTTLRKSIADFTNVHRSLLSIAHLLADPWYASPLGNHYNHVHADFNPQGTGTPPPGGGWIGARRGFHGRLSQDTKFQAHAGERVDITPNGKPMQLRIVDWKNGLAELSSELDWVSRGARG